MRWGLAFDHACVCAGAPRTLQAQRAKLCKRRRGEELLMNCLSFPRLLNGSARDDAIIHNRHVESIACALGAPVALFEGGDIQINAGKIVENDFSCRTALELGKRFDVTKTALARLDHGSRATLLRHERGKLVMIRHAAVRAEQTVRLPFSATAAAAEITAPFDASDFGEGRPGATHRTISFHPAYRFS